MNIDKDNGNKIKTRLKKLNSKADKLKPCPWCRKEPYLWGVNFQLEGTLKYQ